MLTNEWSVNMGQEMKLKQPQRVGRDDPREGARGGGGLRGRPARAAPQDFTTRCLEKPPKKT